MNSRFILPSALVLVLLLVSKSAISQTAGDYVAQAKEEIAEQDYDAAIITCTRALLLNPKLAEAYSLRGVAETMSDDPNSAWRDFTAAIAFDKKNAANYRYRAGLEEHQDDNEEAVLDIDTAIRLDATNADAYNLRGFLYLVNHDSSAAMRDLNRALKLQPKFADAYFNRAVLYEWQRKNDSARSDYTTSITLSPTDSRAWAGRARIALTMLDTAAARADIQKAIDLETLPYYYQLRAGMAYTFAEASETLDTAIQLDPTDASSYYVRGVERRAGGDTTGAMADFAQAIRIAPRYEQALMASAELKSDLGEYFSAVEDATQAIMTDSSEFRYYDYRASYYLGVEDSDRALADYTQAISLNERDSLALATRAWILNERGDGEECIKAVEAFLLHYPKEAWAHRYYAWYVRSDDPKLAIAEYDTAIAFDGTEPDDYYWRGKVREGMDDYVSAVRDFEQAVRLDSLVVYDWKELGLARIELKDYTGAIAALDRAIHLRPTDGALWSDRASVHEAMNDLEAAKEDYQNAVMKSPTAESYIMRSHFFLRQHDTASAIEDLTSAIHRDAGTDTYKTRGVLEELSGKYESAVSDYSIIINREPSNAHPWLMRGNAYYRWGHYQEAFDDYSVSIGLDPNIASAYANRAQMASRLSKDSVAFTDATRAIELDSTLSNAYFVRARVQMARGNWQDAVKDFSRVIQSDPHRHEAYLYRALAFEEAHDHTRAVMDATIGEDALDRLEPEFATRVRALRDNR